MVKPIKDRVERKVWAGVYWEVEREVWREVEQKVYQVVEQLLND